MKKKLLTLIAGGIMAAAMSFTAFAGGWQQDQTGWWYQNDDGTYLTGGWNWVDGKCYYFTAEGYCLTGTTTPDGYTVDASGAWIVDGVVQTQGTSGAVSDAGSGQAAGEAYTVNGLTFTPPAGFYKDNDISDSSSLYFYNDNLDGVIGVMSEDIPEAAQYGTLLEMYSETILDAAMNSVGTPIAKGVKQFPTGTWYCYLYDAATEFDIPGQVYAYGRISGARVQMIMLIGNIGIAPDDVLMNYLR